MTTKKIPANIRTLASELKTAMTVNGDVITASDDLYASTLKDAPFTIDTVQQVQEHRQTFQAAVGLAAGELTADAFANDSDLSQMTFETKIGHDTSSFAGTRVTVGDVVTPTMVSSYHAVDMNREVEAVTDSLMAMMKKAAKA